MIEEKLKVDRLINGAEFKGPALQWTPGQFLAQPPKALTIQESTPFNTGALFQKKKSNVVLGEGPKAHRNFQWLSWYPGAISHVPFDKDVLTGPMSGCWLVLFRLNGVLHAGHIGTELSATSENTKAVKAAWTAFAANHPHDVIAGFQPMKGESIPVRKNLDKSFPGTPTYFAVLERGSNKFYSVATYRQDCVEIIYRIARVTKFTSVLPHFS